MFFVFFCGYLFLCLFIFVTTFFETSSLSEPIPHKEKRHIQDTIRLMSPRLTKEKIPASPEILNQVLEHRKTISHILLKKDPRLLVIVGPCSIHDPLSAREYATKLAILAQELRERVFLVMRVYFEKPRTSMGWKGMVSDPHLDNSGDIEHGIITARQLLRDIVSLGLPAATEFLDPAIPHYLEDLISWSAIGARTTESQIHRTMASGLSMPVGFKNGTDGTIQTAIDAIHFSRAPHRFLGIDEEGMTCIVTTKGNEESHLVLRGGRNGTNYHPSQIAQTIQQLQAAHIPTSLIIDCSHANSSHDPMDQQAVWTSLLAQRHDGCQEIVGAMIESHLEQGQQSLTKNLSELRYGVSITDSCLDWKTTERLLQQA